jgi:hypothetical protein
MLRNRLPERGRHAPPVDVIHGVEVKTFVSFEWCRRGRIICRDYVTTVNGRPVAELSLDCYDHDRQAWEQHWRIRKEVRRRRI